jgi:transposase-like protein
MHQALATEAQIERIHERIESGESMRSIARDIGCSVSTLWKALYATEERRERSARALERSAESWLDLGAEAILSSMSKSGDVDPAAARAYAQECARRAAIRNPRYRDNVQVEHRGQVSVQQLPTDDLMRIAAQALPAGDLVRLGAMDHSVSDAQSSCVDAG